MLKKLEYLLYLYEIRVSEGEIALKYNRENSIKSLMASIILVIVIAVFAAGGILLFGGEAPEKEDAYPWITSDPAAANGMLDGTYYEGEKNDAGKLSYKIAGEITVGTDGRGDFKIENSGKNSCLMKVTIYISGEAIYQTGYIKPNQHIYEDTFDKIPEIGTYSAEAVFEGFDPNTEESIGATKANITITVIE